MGRNIVYVGFVGEKNIGDEAIYTASKKLFSQHTLIPYYQKPKSEIMLIGGGTMLPEAITENEYRGHNFTEMTRSYGIGVGVQHPSYYNRRKGKIDISHTLGQRDIDLDLILNKLGFVGSGFRRLNSIFGDPMNVSGKYITKLEYRQIENYGFDFLGVRGPLTQSVISETTEQDSKVVGDTALYLEPDEYVNKETNRIAVCLRGPGGNWSDYEDNLDELIRVCNSFSDDYTFVLLPFYPPDQELHQELNQRIQNSVLKDFYTNTDLTGLLNEISSTDLMVGEKLHANVLSASCHVPMISLQYKPKNLDFMSSINLENLNVTPDQGGGLNFKTVSNLRFIIQKLSKLSDHLSLSTGLV